jgi:hypothetical protein
MLEPFLAPPTDLGPIIALARHIDHAVLLYLAAAIIARFWHKRIWLIYFGFALAAVLTSHQ